MVSYATAPKGGLFVCRQGRGRHWLRQGQGRPRPWTPGWGRLRPQTPEKLRRGSGERKGSGPRPGWQREQGALLQGRRMARPWKPPSAVSKRLLGYGGLRRGKGGGTRRGYRKSKRYRGSCGKGWARRAQEIEVVPGVLRERMGREGAGERSVPGGAAGAQSARKGAARGLGPRPRLWFWGRALPGPKTPPPPRGVAGRGRKGASTPHSDALALQFFGKMGTIARRINL